MERIRVAFLILHYGDYLLTQKAIRTIKRMEGVDGCKILIVDNASSDNGGKKIKELYGLDPMVDILLLSENMGFSKGNNAGFFYLKQRYKVEFLIVMNNDVFIEQKDFLYRLYALYKKNPFYVAGPDIYIPRFDYHSSPLKRKMCTLYEAYSSLIHINKEIARYENARSLSILKGYLSDKYSQRGKFLWFYKMKRKILKNNSLYEMELSDCVLQGACIIFDNRFYECNDKIFVPETFLYSEEDLLALRCKKNNWKMVYFPSLKVLHLHKGSTNKKKESFGEYCKKKAFQKKIVKQSLETYIRELKSYENNIK